MAVDKWDTVTIETLISDGVITAHKDGNYGSFYPRTSEFGKQGVPFLTAKFISDSGQLQFSEAPRLKLAKAEKLSFGFIEEGDVLLSHNATIGRVAVVPRLRERMLVGTSLTYFRLNQSCLLPRYLAVYFSGRGFQNQLKAVMTHSTRNQVPITAQRKLKVVVPPVSEQQCIADTLGTLDDKIELNRRMNETLEAMARRLFKSWFVDFEPVHAKAAGATSFPSMPQDVFDSLPDRFERTQAGLCPSGWKVRQLGDDIVIVKGRSYKSIELQPSTTALVTLKSIARGGGYRHEGLKPYSGPFKPDQVVKPGDLVVAFTDLTQEAAVIGKPAIVRENRQYQTLVASLDLGIVRPRTDVSIPFLYCLFKTDDFQSHIYGHTNGSTVLHLGKHGLPSYHFVVPDKKLHAAFLAIAGPTFDCIDALEGESRKLTELRDYLLPKLLSGEVRVRDAEKWAEQPDAFQFDDDQEKTDPTSTSVATPYALSGHSRPRIASQDENTYSDAADVQSVLLVAEAAEPPVTANADRPPPIDDRSTEEVMAAFRQAARNRGWMTRDELLKRVADHLGYRRLGTVIRQRLKNHLRAALRRRIIAADGPDRVAAGTTSMTDYSTDDLVDVVRSVLRPGQAMRTDDATRAVANHLGFTRLVGSVQAPIAAALDAAARRGTLEADDDTIRRVV